MHLRCSHSVSLKYFMILKYLVSSVLRNAVKLSTNAWNQLKRNWVIKLNGLTSSKKPVTKKLIYTIVTCMYLLTELKLNLNNN